MHRWLFDMLDRCSGLQATVVTVTFWHILEARNASRNNEAKACPLCTMKKIQAFVDMIWFSRTLLKPGQISWCEAFKQLLRWLPPRVGLEYINVYAAFFSPLSSSAVGMVLWDHMWRRLTACCQSFQGVTLPELAEVLAVGPAFLLFLRMGATKLCSNPTDCRWFWSSTQRIGTGLRWAQL